MKIRLLAIIGLVTCALPGWAQTTNSTCQVFDVGREQVEEAITNAFDQWRYKRMDLESAQMKGAVPGWRATNGWILFPLDGPIGVVRWKNSKQFVPYIPTFHIVVQPQGTNRTAVVVRTINARVIHGKELGVHGGWANHEVDVPPVLSEETNVLGAIANTIINGRPAPLAGGSSMVGPEREAFEKAVKAAEALRRSGTN